MQKSAVDSSIWTETRDTKQGNKTLLYVDTPYAEGEIQMLVDLDK